MFDTYIYIYLFCQRLNFLSSRKKNPYIYFQAKAKKKRCKNCKRYNKRDTNKREDFNLQLILDMKLDCLSTCLIFKL